MRMEISLDSGYGIMASIPYTGLALGFQTVTLILKNLELMQSSAKFMKLNYIKHWKIFPLKWPKFGQSNWY